MRFILLALVFIECSILNSSFTDLSFLNSFFDYNDNFLLAIAYEKYDLIYLFLEDEPTLANKYSQNSKLRNFSYPYPLGLIIELTSSKTSPIDQDFTQPLVQILKNYGADISKQPTFESGQPAYSELATPLCIAAKYKLDWVIEWLISNGADIKVGITKTDYLKYPPKEITVTASHCTTDPKIQKLFSNHYPQAITFAVPPKPKDLLFLKLNGQLFEAIKKNETQKAQELIDEIIKIHPLEDCCDYKTLDEEPLYKSLPYLAAEKNNTELLMYIIHKGYNFDTKVNFARDKRVAPPKEKTVRGQIQELNNPAIDQLMIGIKISPQPQPASTANIKQLQDQLTSLNIELSSLSKQL